jgi:DNA-binding CsgD family transcriptional regulator
VYCGVILTCYEAFDIRRAHEWTRVLDEWTAPQQGLVPFRGQCLVHRAQIKRMHGEWADALAEAERARERLADPPGQPAIGLAYYQLGELNRERGEFDEAERAYREAHRAGHPIQPGLALLRLAQGRTGAAAAAIDTALDEAPERSAARARLLPAVVEIALAGDDLRRARNAAEELAEVAERFDAPVLRAESAAALGALRLAEGDATAARTSLRVAQQRWQELDVPYEVARTQARLSLASTALEDDDTAALERDAARRTFTELGAGPALSALEPRSSERRGGLTAREVEILKLVATGMTNKEIAEVLVISRKTVARHLSNVFTKLGLKTRAEATAYAFKHGLA